MILRFLLYGVIGWCMEILWTGLHSFLNKDFRLMANTSIWMFFIYGLAIFLEPIYLTFKAFPIVVRGGVYVICIFIVEYATGNLLKKADICPWDYSHSKYNVKGIIRWDYAPVWFICGLIFEGVYRTLL